MKKQIVRAVVSVVLIVMLGATSGVFAQGPKPGDVLYSDNFTDFSGDDRMAKGWLAWATMDCWQESPDADKGQRAPCVVPEYKQANPMGEAYPSRAHEGEGDNAQQYFTVYANHNAGIWRQYKMPPGYIVEILAWGTAWSSSDNNPNSFDGGQDVKMRIGVDPTGGNNPGDKKIVWGESANPPNKWMPIPPVKVTAGQEGSITVYLRSQPKWPLVHNDFYWDDVAIVYRGQAAPQIAVGATPVPNVVAVVPTPVDPILAGLVTTGVGGGGPLEEPAETGGSNPVVVGALLAVCIVTMAMWNIVRRKVR
jgi:hypothetical protein